MKGIDYRIPNGGRHSLWSKSIPKCIRRQHMKLGGIRKCEKSSYSCRRESLESKIKVVQIPGTCAFTPISYTYQTCQTDHKTPHWV